MFGFSLPKLLFTALIIGAVLYGFKYLSRRNDKDANIAGEMDRCSICGEFVVLGAAQDCGKSRCPYDSQ
jgi:hypothetical protein